MTPKQTIKRLTYLQDMICKYAYRWDKSDRVMGWVYEYEDIRNTVYVWKSTPEQNQIWKDFCSIRGSETSHTGYDCLA